MLDWDQLILLHKPNQRRAYVEEKLRTFFTVFAATIIGSLQTGKRMGDSIGNNRHHPPAALLSALR